MVKNFVNWFIVFVLSLLVSVLGIAEQAKAFLFIYLILGIITLLRYHSFLLARLKEIKPEALKLSSFILSLIFIMLQILVLLIALLISKLFNVNFYIVFEILTFLSCLFNIKITISY